MTIKAPEQKKDFGEIALTTPVYISLIPTIANAVLVKYDPEIQVSCVIPPREYDVAYSAKHERAKKKNIKVKAPSLIMSCGYSDIPTPQTYRQVASSYGLYVIDESRKKEIFAKPYLLANVWDKTGKICFGTLTPGSLRQAFNYYWTSGFNTDLMRSPHNCDNQAHYYDYHMGCRCTKQKSHNCDCGDELFHNHFGCGCNTVAKSKKCKGTCGEQEAAEQNKRCACCMAIKIVIKDALKSNPKLSKSKIAGLAKNPSLSDAIVKVYPGCACGVRHKKSCSCRLGTCSCPCNCNCCLKKCGHQNCKCQCCKGLCSCPCRCSELQKLAQHLASYHDTLVKDQSWVNFTSTFCGTKYWAAPQGADGVLVTNNRQLLNAIPKEFWRKDRLGQPLIICLANRQKNEWKLESGGFTFSLKEDYVITK